MRRREQAELPDLSRREREAMVIDWIYWRSRRHLPDLAARMADTELELIECGIDPWWEDWQFHAWCEQGEA
jgi:hypothetical protein